MDKLETIHVSIWEAFLVFKHAFAVDTATICYLLLLPWLLTSLYLIFRKAYFITSIRWYLCLVTLLSLFLVIAELGVYGEWEEKPGIEILTYMQHPSEVINSSPIAMSLGLLALLLVLSLATFKVIHKYMVFKAPHKQHWSHTLIFFITAFLIILIGGRGGIGEVPISQSDAYFSHHKILNDAAVNTTYNFIHAVVWNQAILDGNNPFQSSIGVQEKQAVLAKLTQQHTASSFPKIFTTSRPNIVLVILESWSGDFLEDNAQYQSVTPNFHAMAEKGVLFSQAYASGTLSHEGLPAILSAWPAISGIYITNLPNKVSKLPSITQTLNNHAYDTMFLYGGQLRYGNMTSYIYANQFQKILEEKDFPNDTPRGPLGIHDEHTFTKFHQEIKQLKEPFFATMFTASSHSPYVQPMQDEIFWGGAHNPYLNSVLYADKSIQSFMRKVKQEKYYHNTLFVFVADHSHITPNNYNRNQANWHHVPMLFYGDVIKPEYRGTHVSQIVSQHDLVSTILAQMDINHQPFTWSRNVLRADYQESAYYTVNQGHGFITHHGSYAFNAKEKQVLYNTLPTDEQDKTKYGHVFIEQLMESILQK
ncbi:MAG: LTA synthase family protein [Mariprofundaceae bacterium]|nr:LTA synthase family protein [Mariprofundaceae bacterium]